MFIASLILIQVIIFIAFIVIARKVISKNVGTATKHLEVLDEDYTKKENEINRQLDGTKQKTEEMLTQAKKDADELKKEIIKGAEGEKEKIVIQARTQGDDIIKQADKSRQLLLSEIDERISKEAVNKAAELIQLAIPEQFKFEIHTQWVEELISQGFGKISRLQIPKDIQEVKITTAFDLKDKQLKDLSEKLKSVLKRSVKIRENIDKSIVAGLIINIGSLILDGSLKNKIKEKMKDE